MLLKVVTFGLFANKFAGILVSPLQFAKVYSKDVTFLKLSTLGLTILIKFVHLLNPNCVAPIFPQSFTFVTYCVNV